MEQIKQILAQMSLNLELNIAMCDMIEDHGKRIEALESSSKAQKTRLDALYTRVSEMSYINASKAYEGRKSFLKDSKND